MFFHLHIKRCSRVFSTVNILTTGVVSLAKLFKVTKLTFIIFRRRMGPLLTFRLYNVEKSSRDPWQNEKGLIVKQNSKKHCFNFLVIPPVMGLFRAREYQCHHQLSHDSLDLASAKKGHDQIIA